MSGSLLQEASCGLQEVKNSKHPVSLRHELEKTWEVPFLLRTLKILFAKYMLPTPLGTSGRLDDKCAVKVPRTLEPPTAGVEAPRGDVVHGHVCSGRPGAQPGAPETIPRPPEMQSHHRERGSGRAGPSQGSQGHTELQGAHTLRGFCRRQPVRQPGRKRHCPRSALHSRIHISLLFAGAADVVPNNGAPSQDTAVTDSKRTADPKNAWPEASPADPGGRPHLVRLFSRDAPGREDNTFKDRPSESDELQTIQEDSAAAPGAVDAMAAQKRPSQRSKYLASASTMDHARHGFLPRHRDTGILDSLGRFFGTDRGAPKRGSGKVSSEE